MPDISKFRIALIFNRIEYTMKLNLINNNEQNYTL